MKKTATESVTQLHRPELKNSILNSSAAVSLYVSSVTSRKKKRRGGAEFLFHGSGKPNAARRHTLSRVMHDAAIQKFYQNLGKGSIHYLT